MTTVRELIKKAVEIKAKCYGITFEESLQQPLYFLFYTNNGVQFVISMNPRIDKLNKNNIYRRVNIDVIEGRCMVPDEMNQYQKHPCSIFSYGFSNVPERIVNQCFVMNSGINIERFVREWEKLLS